MNPMQLWQTIGTVAGGLGVFLATWYAVVTRPILKQIAAMDARMASGFSEVNRRLERIEEKLDNHAERIARLEEKSWR